MRNSKRRANDARYFARALKIQKHRLAYSLMKGLTTKEQLITYTKTMMDNLKNCSCFMCCNERRNNWNSKLEKLTIAERKNLEKFKEEINTYD